jgi:hypothetical protein
MGELSAAARRMVSEWRREVTDDRLNLLEQGVLLLLLGNAATLILLVAVLSMPEICR